MNNEQRYQAEAESKMEEVLDGSISNPRPCGHAPLQELAAELNARAADCFAAAAYAVHQDGANGYKEHFAGQQLASAARQVHDAYSQLTSVNLALAATGRAAGPPGVNGR